MVKTTVYLPETDIAALRKLAAQTGRSQAEIIRGAVASVTAEAQVRTFRSLGAGRGSGEPVCRNADSILRGAFAQPAR